MTDKQDEKQWYDLDKDSHISDDYYDKLASSRGLGSSIHARRFDTIRRLVQSHYSEGMTIADFACGNCSWNIDKLPVWGIDNSKKTLDYCLSQNRITKAYLERVEETSLQSSSVDIAVITETLEHLPEPAKAITEIRRVLKPGGRVIVSVPYDTPLSFWRPLFYILCLYKGTMCNNSLYKNKCGHIQRFSPSSLKQLLESQGFRVEKQMSIIRVVLFTIAAK